MDEKEKERIMQKVREHALRAKQAGQKLELTLKSGETDSLSRVINTQEKADLFMKMLEWSSNK